mmetsp:Transcript_35172/g.108998  ORF Transcript_35172/g.108998 Transcript_35172/m.108998 type:complete len:258 (-) Transcript_35172:148-921(-)
MTRRVSFGAAQPRAACSDHVGRLDDQLLRTETRESGNSEGADKAQGPYGSAKRRTRPARNARPQPAGPKRTPSAGRPEMAYRARLDRLCDELGLSKSGTLSADLQSVVEQLGIEFTTNIGATVAAAEKEVLGTPTAADGPAAPPPAAAGEAAAPPPAEDDDDGLQMQTFTAEQLAEQRFNAAQAKGDILEISDDDEPAKTPTRKRPPRRRVVASDDSDDDDEEPFMWHWPNHTGRVHDDDDLPMWLWPNYTGRSPDE